MNIALVGATGTVGRQILEQLAARNFPVGTLRLIASPASAGDFVEFSEESLPVGMLSDAAFAGIDLAIFATPAAVSDNWCQIAQAAGATCFDLSASARLVAARPLLVAGVNDAQFTGSLLSTPASLTVQLAILAHALELVGDLADLLVTTVSPASAQGELGLAELRKQTGELLNGRPAPNEIFPAQLAFNCLPSTDLGTEGSGAEELRKVLGTADLAIHINRLQLPLFYGEGGFVRVEFKSAVETAQLKTVLAAAEGLKLCVEQDLPAPLEAIGADDLLVQLSVPSQESSTVFNLWYAADNIGRCAAGNVVRLAEILAARNL